MATKEKEVPAAPAEGAVSIHLDEFLNKMHAEIQTKLGVVHVESLSAFAKAQKLLGYVKRTEEEWRKDFAAWLDEKPK